MHGSIKKFVAHLGTLDQKQVMYHGETVGVMVLRWTKLDKDLYDDDKKAFDFSKIPDIYDCIKYDVLHNTGVDKDGLVGFFALLSHTKLTDCYYLVP